jgi:hypothetical protein
MFLSTSVEVVFVLSMMRLLLPKYMQDQPPPKERIEIACAIATASSETKLFNDMDGHKTMALETGIAFFESGFHKQLRGDCKRDEEGILLPVGAEGCKHPACGPFGVQAFTEEECHRYETDLLLAARKSIAVVKKSLADCKENPVLDRLAEYTSGRCDWGWAESEHRMKAADRILYETEAR